MLEHLEFEKCNYILNILRQCIKIEIIYASLNEFCAIDSLVIVDLLQVDGLASYRGKFVGTKYCSFFASLFGWLLICVRKFRAKVTSWVSGNIFLRSSHNMYKTLYLWDIPCLQSIKVNEYTYQYSNMDTIHHDLCDCWWEFCPSNMLKFNKAHIIYDQDYNQPTFNHFPPSIFHSSAAISVVLEWKADEETDEKPAKRFGINTTKANKESKNGQWTQIWGEPWQTGRRLQSSIVIQLKRVRWGALATAQGEEH